MKVVSGDDFRDAIVVPEEDICTEFEMDTGIGDTYCPEGTRMLISESCIKLRRHVLAREIANKYRGKEIAALYNLTGAGKFTWDTTGDIWKMGKNPVRVYPIKTKAYAGDTTGTGDISLMLDLPHRIEGEPILFEDIADRGYTMDFVLRHTIRNECPVCTLLDKPSRRKKDVPLTYRVLKSLTSMSRATA